MGKTNNKTAKKAPKTAVVVDAIDAVHLAEQEEDADQTVVEQPSPAAIAVKASKNSKKAAKRAANGQAAPAAKVAKQRIEEDAATAAMSAPNNDDDAMDVQDVDIVKVEKKTKKAAKEPKTKAAAKKQPAKENDDADTEDDDEEDDDDDDDDKPTVDDTKRTTGGVSVFVGNLPGNIKRGKIIKLFAPHAAVKAVRFRRSDGGQLFNAKPAELASIIAFVDVADERVASAAADALNGTAVGGHVLRVNLQRSAKTAETMDEKRTVVVGNLPYNCTDEVLRETFECCGEIEYVRTLQTLKGCSGLGFVCFAEAAAVPMAQELNNGLLLERPIRVSRYQARKKPAEGKPTRRHQTFGAQRRLAVKKGKRQADGGQEKGAGRFARSGGGGDKDGRVAKKKKSEFTGAKVSDKKKAVDKKKKGGPKGPKLLAKKIAPREKKVAV